MHSLNIILSISHTIRHAIHANAEISRHHFSETRIFGIVMGLVGERVQNYRVRVKSGYQTSESGPGPGKFLFLKPGPGSFRVISG